MHGNFPCSHVLTGCEFVWNWRLQGIDLYIDFKISKWSSEVVMLQASSPNGSPASSYDARILMSWKNHSTCIQHVSNASSLCLSLLYSLYSFFRLLRQNENDCNANQASICHLLWHILQENISQRPSQKIFNLNCMDPAFKLPVCESRTQWDKQ